MGFVLKVLPLVAVLILSGWRVGKTAASFQERTTAQKAASDLDFLKTDNWRDGTAMLFVPGTGAPSKAETVSVKRSAAAFELDLAGVQFWLNTISGFDGQVRFPASPIKVLAALVSVRDPHSKDTQMFVQQQDSFFISDKSELLGCTLFAGSLFWRTSVFKAPGTHDEALSRFVSEFDRKRLSEQKQLTEKHVSLEEAAPPEFFNPVRGSVGPFGSGPPDPRTPPYLPQGTTSVTDGVLRLDILAGERQGTFWIDLNTAKVLSSVVSGKEVVARPGETTPGYIPRR